MDFSEFYQEIGLPFLEALDSSCALRVAIHARYDDWESIRDITVDPLHYCEADLYLRNVAAVDFFRKCKQLPVKNGTATALARTFDKWLEAEKQCCITNLRFCSLAATPRSVDVDERVYQSLMRVQKWFRRILGPLHEGVLEEPHLGPGTALGLESGRSTVPDKFTTRPTVTLAGLNQVLPFWEDTAWFRCLGDDYKHMIADTDHPFGCVIVRHDRWTTADKTAFIKRGISIGPLVNVYYQLSVGAHIAKRLRRFGIDKRGAQKLHRLLAREASRNGESATVDLTSASDTVASQVVKFLATHDWYSFLSSLRCTTTLVKTPEGEEKYYHLQKFSAMGNGFTFELETLIFLSIALASMEEEGCEPIPGHNVSVFGDDIILPVECSANLLAKLKFFGFTPNSAKTFVTSCFRESCGGDYFNGVAVRPYYLEDIPHEPQQWISLANGISRLARQNSEFVDDLPSLKHVWFRVLARIPSDIRRCRGPEHLGDLVINDRPAAYSVRIKHSITQYRCYKPIHEPISLDHWGPATILASALYGVPTAGPIPRKGEELRTSGYKVQWLPRIYKLGTDLPNPGTFRSDVDIETSSPTSELIQSWAHKAWT